MAKGKNFRGIGLAVAVAMLALPPAVGAEDSAKILSPEGILSMVAQGSDDSSEEPLPPVQEWIQQADALEAKGAYQEAARLWEKIVAWAEEALGPDHTDTAKSLNNLAELYRQQGAYTKAEPLYLRALAITEKALGPDHVDTATSLNNLAELSREQGAYAKAEPLYSGFSNF
jgi:tetratricopeptide (TPR) repeat protein